MRLKPEHLAKHLQQSTLSPVYFITGDESLIVQESADAIRSNARQQGFSDRELFHAEANFDWNQLLIEANSMSLFAEKKILEVRLPTGKPNDKGKAFLEYAAKPPADTLLLIIGPKIDATTLRSKWAKTLESCGTLIQVWPVNAAQLPNWIKRRLRQADIRASDQAVEVLADRVEGNLLAAAQEIEKLRLLAIDGEVDAQTMSTVVADSARYNVFNLVDKILEGDSQTVARNLRGLQDEGAEPGAILWALGRELRLLIKASEAVGRGEHLDWALGNLKVWDKRKPLVRNALQRIKPAHLKLMLRQCGGIDRAIKGMSDASPWEELTSLALGFSGQPSLTAKNIRLGLQDNY